MYFLSYSFDTIFASNFPRSVFENGGNLPSFMIDCDKAAKSVLSVTSWDNGKGWRSGLGLAQVSGSSENLG